MSFLKKIVDSIPNDKKDHNILGDIVNPFIYIISFIIFQNNIFYYGFLLTFFFHISIEIYQYISKSGKFELLDAFSGMYSSILIFLTYLYINI